jgi:hypothetical protein
MAPFGIKDYIYLAILVGLIVFAWWFAAHERRIGEDEIRSQDAKALTEQVQRNAELEKQWQDAFATAEGNHEAEKKALGDTVTDLQQRLHDYESRPAPVPSRSPIPPRIIVSSGVSSGDTCPRPDPEVEAARDAVIVAAAHDGERLELCRAALAVVLQPSARTP